MDGVLVMLFLVNKMNRRSYTNSHLTLFSSSPHSGQSNYGWANSVCERVAASRVRDGLPGVAIQWGGVGDVGVLADTLGEIEVYSLLYFCC